MYLNTCFETVCHRPHPKTISLLHCTPQEDPRKHGDKIGRNLASFRSVYIFIKFTEVAQILGYFCTKK
jgi:hypothetical protein